MAVLPFKFSQPPMPPTTPTAVASAAYTPKTPATPRLPATARVGGFTPASDRNYTSSRARCQLSSQFLAGLACARVQATSFSPEGEKLDKVRDDIDANKENSHVALSTISTAVATPAAAKPRRPAPKKRGGGIGAFMRAAAAKKKQNGGGTAVATLVVPNTTLAAHVVVNPRPLESAFSLGAELGSGSFGQVFVGLGLAASSGTDAKPSRVAIKKLWKVSKAQVANVAREVTVMRALESHRHLVRLLDVMEDDAAMMLIMEYVGGGSLLDVLSKQTEPYGEAQGTWVGIFITGLPTANPTRPHNTHHHLQCPRSRPSCCPHLHLCMAEAWCILTSNPIISWPWRPRSIWLLVAVGSAVGRKDLMEAGPEVEGALSS